MSIGSAAEQLLKNTGLLQLTCINTHLLWPSLRKCLRINGSYFTLVLLYDVMALLTGGGGPRRVGSQVFDR